MGGPPAGNAASFVLETLFGLYILLVMLRLLLQWVRADFYNPVSQFIVKATQPVLRPLRRVIPGVAGVDLAAVTLLLVLQMAEIWLILLLFGRSASLVGLSVLAVAKLLNLLVYVFMFAIIVLVVLSWVQPQGYNPVVGLLSSLSAPIMGPARRLLPPIAGLDLSPIVAFLVLGVLQRLLIWPLESWGTHLL